MAKTSMISVDGKCFFAREGALLLDAALSNGIDLPSNCRAGYCGTCRVHLISGTVQGGEGCEPGIVHACQCRIVGDAVIERAPAVDVRTVEGVLSSLRPLSSDVVEAGITTDRAFPYHAGQFAQVRFGVFPSRPFSITHPLPNGPGHGSVFFHIRRMKAGRVTSSLGRRIKLGHRVQLSGPYGSAYFRPGRNNRLILVATNTGFAPVWAIAVAALRENPQRELMVIAGGGTLDALYMAPALVQLARFPNVRVVPVCSSPNVVSPAVRPGRPTDYLPPLQPIDELYACGAPPMVAAIKSIAELAGASCHADPFVLNRDDPAKDGVLTRAWKWLSLHTQKADRQPRRVPSSRGKRRAPACGKSGAEVHRHQWS